MANANDQNRPMKGPRDKAALKGAWGFFTRFHLNESLCFSVSCVVCLEYTTNTISWPVGVWSIKVSVWNERYDKDWKYSLCHILYTLIFIDFTYAKRIPPIPHPELHGGRRHFNYYFLLLYLSQSVSRQMYQNTQKLAYIFQNWTTDLCTFCFVEEEAWY